MGNLSYLKCDVGALNFYNLWILLFFPRSGKHFIKSQCFFKLVRQNLESFVRGSFQKFCTLYCLFKNEFIL
jgi:hypothetical protein